MKMKIVTLYAVCLLLLLATALMVSATVLSMEDMGELQGGCDKYCINRACPPEGVKCKANYNKPGYFYPYCDSHTPDIACDNKANIVEIVTECKVSTLGGPKCTVNDPARGCGATGQCECDTLLHKCNYTETGIGGTYAWSGDC